MNYAIEFQGKPYGPDGVCALGVAVQTYNQELERKQLADLRTHPDKVFLYVKAPTKQYVAGTIPHPPVGDEYQWSITTWLGTVVSTQCYIGPVKRFPCFGHFPSKRRAVTCHIFGRVYHGWYYESSGDYCRLKLAKNQPKWAED